jgi:hypothetical protein
VRDVDISPRECGDLMQTGRKKKRGCGRRRRG